MRYSNNRLKLSPSDLSGYLNCHHLTSLDLRAANGEFERPQIFSPVTQALQEKGIEHEESYLAHLKLNNNVVIELEDNTSLEDTKAAMASGADVIYQAKLSNVPWSGYADFLVKVAKPSKLGTWSYEVQDTKLAREIRAGTILQLSVYSMILEELQGIAPEFMHVVSPGKGWQPESFRTAEFGAYFRLLQRNIKEFTDSPATTYPEPVSHCELCAYWQTCEKIRRSDDHLAYVAGMQTNHIEQLRATDINSLEAFANAEEITKPTRGSLETLLKLQDQARIQLKGRVNNSNEVELKTPVDTEHGFQRLPLPSPEDIYLDFEGSHFTEGGVQEYLTGYVTLDKDGQYHYVELWADTIQQEQLNFEQFIDTALQMREDNPAAHIYHFAPYETAALKRMMGRFASRERELDTLLRKEAFVDLHAIVKRSLIASVESYSIKNLEPFFGYQRQQDLREASASRRIIEAALENGVLDDALVGHKQIVSDYNREDCESTHRLHVWLETVRTGVEQTQGPIPRLSRDPEDEKPLNELDIALGELREALIADAPKDPVERTPEEQARFLLGHMMEFHRREDKATWWEFFRLRDVLPEDLLNERRAMDGLSFKEIVNPKKAPVIRYQFTSQDVDARSQDTAYNEDDIKVGTVTAIDHKGRTIDITHSMATANDRPATLFFHSYINSKEIRESLMRLGAHVVSNGLTPQSPYSAALKLLALKPPVTTGKALRKTGEAVDKAAVRIAQELDHDVLAIQGPPGAGKTYAASQIILELVKAKKTVGITAVGHRVIHNLLEKTAEAARDMGMANIGLYHRSSTNGKYEGDLPIENINKYSDVLSGLTEGSIKVLGGTQWMWSRPDFVQAVDVLIVDEAGQMSLANVLASAPAAKSLILLGDPQQLEQPIQSAHPEGSDVAALKHWLGEHETMPADRGLFLDETWRLHPDICEFTSEIYYESKLSSRPNLVNQTIRGSEALSGSGLRFIPVNHTGNTARSTEEADVIAGLVAQLSSGVVAFVDQHDEERDLQRSDILIVAPYNAQVATLKEKLPELANQIGTVDKFQGQEAPVVIYSMTSSTPEDAPRGMEFLYNPNRFNVATSRARSLCLLVGNPCLLEPTCKTPAQIRMANGFCRYREMAYLEL